MTPDALLADFDGELFRFLHRAQPKSGTFREMVSYHLAWRSWDDAEPAVADAGGKRVRPLLALLTAQTVSGDHRAALPAAIAVQLVHDFSIILDDIMDRDRVRRNRPSLWVGYGTGQAMTAAAGLYVIGLDALQDYLDTDVPHRELRGLTRTLLDSCLEMADSQHLDLDWEKQFGMTLDQVRAVALGRSCLIRCGAELAADVSTSDPEVQAAFREFGALLSTAFSIIDDHRGLWGDELRNGKPLRSDIRQHKKTFPIVAGYLRCDPVRQRRMRDLLTGPELGDAEVAAVMDLLDEAGAEEATTREVRRLSGLALECLHRPALAQFDVSDLAGLTENLLGGPATTTHPVRQGGSA
ncbi:polyprenyl synthetase family protein [Amycolatopsis sp. NBC_00345]|uniref:polyprenyl synthetase family protein n=1 Tax=Amycolatopsis sp. NBC_00345 TaxID=2975955 RepID=UPI002E2725B9